MKLCVPMRHPIGIYSPQENIPLDSPTNKAIKELIVLRLNLASAKNTHNRDIKTPLADFESKSQIMKVCLGMLPLNQTRLDQGAIRCIGRKDSPTLAITNTLN